MLKIPSYKIDAAPIYIHASDTAWDNERIEREQAEAANDNADKPKSERIDLDAHPVLVYRRGETRYDLDTQIPWRGEMRRVTDYLLPGETPVKFVLRRLGYKAFYTIAASGGAGTAGAFNAMCVAACEAGLREVQGDDGALDIDPERERRHPDEMQRLFDLDPNLPVGIGAAVLAASQSLRSAEKK